MGNETKNYNWREGIDLTSVPVDISIEALRPIGGFGLGGV